MKIQLSIFLFLLLLSQSQAQIIDTTSAITTQNKLSYKQFIASSALIGSGFLLKESLLNKRTQNTVRNFFGEDFNTKTDNLLPSIPIAQIYGGRFLGYTSKSDWQHQTVNILISNAITYGIVASMKHSFKEIRPDASDQYSFPSGHTALAFTNASLLYYEYKNTNIWYASSGFLFATATGVLRVANNKHYASDVLTGSGIGLGIGLIVCYWSPFKSLTFRKNKTHAFLYPQVGKYYGMGLVIFK
jgi:membrane-associated phospholipid phosphatase